MADHGFIGQAYVDMLVYEETPEAVLDRFPRYVAPPPKWSTPSLP
jgi:hypothetical protein